MTKEADVYCFGMCALEIQTRNPPFVSCTTIEEVIEARNALNYDKLLEELNTPEVGNIIDLRTRMRWFG